MRKGARVWNRENGFGEVIDFSDEGNLIVRWNRSPWFPEEIPTTAVEICE